MGTTTLMAGIERIIKIMNLYFDCEFTGLHRNTTLISLGIISEDNQRFYAEFTDYDMNQCDRWVKKNVLSNLILQPYMLSMNPEKYKNPNKADEWDILEISNRPAFNGAYFYNLERTIKDDIRQVCGVRTWVASRLRDWISQFDSIQFVSDVCRYDFVLLMDLFGSAWDLPKNVSPVCHDINYAIARYYEISESEAFKKSREEIVKKLWGHEIIEGNKHNAMYDAEVIKAIYDRIYCAG